MAGQMIGEILLGEKLVTPEQLDEALSLQKTFPKQTIGQLLCKLGFLQEVDLVSILEQNGKRQRLSDILLKEKLIDNTQLLNATTVSKKNNITLAQAVLRLRYLDEAVLAKIIAEQYDYSFVHINSFAVEPDIIRYINPIYAQKQRIVPISKIGNTLTLA